MCASRKARCTSSAPSCCGAAPATSTSASPTTAKRRSRRRWRCSFDADFVDLFEVRGMTRAQPRRARPGRGRRQRSGAAVPRARRRRATHAAALRAGADAARRAARRVRAATRARCRSASVLHASPANATAPSRAADAARRLRHRHCARATPRAARRAGSTAHIETSNPLVNRWIDRSLADLAMLTTALPSGPYPYAGVPGTPRRSAATASSPRANTCGSTRRWRAACCRSWRRRRPREAAPQRDAEPGKILHEARRSEMAATRRDPVRPLLRHHRRDAAVRRAGRRLLAAHRRPRLHPRHLAQRAGGARMDRHATATVDGDGLSSTRGAACDGLIQQGWKDSHDSIFHADGRLAAAADRAGRGAGLRLRGQAAAPPSWRRSSTTRRSRASCAPARRR